MKVINFSLFCAVSLILVSATKEPRITYGNDAYRGQFPWHLKIEASDGGTIRYCNGAVIRKDYVITSAECISNRYDFILRFGMVDRFNGNFSRAIRITEPNFIKIHPNFTHLPLVNDIAMMYLEEPLDLTDDYVDEVKLASEDNFIGGIEGVQGVLTGFGLYNDEDPITLSQMLQYGETHIIPDTDCRSYNRTLVYDDKFCTNKLYGNACVGDEGGPFVTKVDDINVLLGFVSIPANPCNSDTPAIFTNLLPYLAWIDGELNDPPPENPKPDGCTCICRCETCPAPAINDGFKSRWLKHDEE